MTTITDAEAQALPPAVRLSNRWEPTEWQPTRPWSGLLIDWHDPRPSRRIVDRLTSALRAAVAAWRTA